MINMQSFIEIPTLSTEL